MNHFIKYNDADLISALKGNRNTSERAFAEIYSRYSQRVYAYCLRMTGLQEDGQDIFQETFIKFYSMVHELSNTTNVPGLLIRIARNLCINFRRDEHETLNIEDFELTSNDRGYDQKELLQLISSSLELLEFELREAFILRHYHGLSHEEMAKITGDSITAIKTRTWRAKVKIKEILAPYLADLSK